MKELTPGFASSRMTTERTRMLVPVLGIVATFVLAACGGSSDSPSAPTTQKDPVGSYAISTINGKALPFALVTSDTGNLFKYEVLSGTAALTSDGKYLLVYDYRQTVLSAVEDFVDTLRGTWSQSGTTLTLVSAQDQTSVDHADWNSAGTLTFTEIAANGTDSLKFLYTIKK